MIDAALRHFFVNSALETGGVIVAVSGGVDSTALLVAMSELQDSGRELAAAHINHHLRGEESDRDETYVRGLCTQLNVPLHVADGTLDPALVSERGIEAAARAVRYALLSSIRQNTGARYVATAHQKNDQAETVLMRLLHGSGIGGLRGIRPVREDGFIRPLLDVRRDEIAHWLHERGIVPRHDSSNDDMRFLRNRIRPLLQDHHYVDSLAAVAAEARAQWPLLERIVDEAERAGAVVTGSETLFKSWPQDLWVCEELLRRHIRRLDPSARDFDAQRIARELPSIRRMSVTKHVEIVRTAEGHVLRRPPEPTPPFELELSERAPAFIQPLGVTLRIARTSTSSGEGGRQIIQLPAGAEPSFVVRNRREGDRFHPLGLAGSKKLKDFLIDRKIPLNRRDRLPLLLWRDEIVWIAGVEVSDRFKVTTPRGELYEVWLEGSGESDGNDSGIHG